MGKKVCENVDSKRELLYSFSTLVFTPLIYYFAVTSAFSTSGDRDATGNSSPAASVSSPSLATAQDGSVGGGSASSVDAGTLSSQQEEKAVGSNDTVVGGDPIIGFILQHRELPFETVFYVVAFEVLKLLVVFTIFPGSHLFDQTPSLQVMWNLTQGGNSGGSGLMGAGTSAGLGHSGKASQARLPFSKRDSAASKSPSLQIKVARLESENKFGKLVVI